jgi:two-component system CheB/CheR fusion protein
MDFASSAIEHIPNVAGQESDTTRAPAAAAAQETPLYIAGVGASAGGLEALERLFRAMPADTGVAFVIIQHLSPDFKSVMDELLARHTRMPIHRVENGMTVRANSIYLIPPKKEMIISGGRLLLTDKDPAQDLSLPIDHFFRSLASDAADRAIAIVLSGTGSDGSRGIRDVHEAGGLVIAQSESTAKFDGMPKSARDTGMVDAALTPEEMPRMLIDYVRQHSAGIARQASPEPAGEHGVDAIFKLLRDEYQIDFSYYKPNTVTRRIERRLSLNQSVDLEDYVQRLRSDPGELNSLYRDLLIGVTRFFRDREAFDYLERNILPDLLTRKRPGEEIRIWIAGCATGEEAYSTAILVHERLSLLKRPINVKIFATDVHGASLETASTGVYNAESLAEVQQERLDRYFTRKSDGYHVAADVRQMIVFARHNVIKDAPFTKLDLISCRNLLIYFQPAAQKKALSLFHFGLRTGGVLMLGPSESPGELAAEFETLEDHWKIYRKRRDIRLPPDLRLPLSSPPGHLRTGALTPSAQPSDISLLIAYDQLLEDNMPPGLLITDRRQLVHAFGGAGQYLKYPDGRPTIDILDLVEGDLKLALAGSMQRAAKDQSPVVYSGVKVPTSGGVKHLRLVVKPIYNRQSNLTHLFIELREIDGARQSGAPAREIDVGEASREQLDSLEEELRHTRENLQATIEELETSNEELQASNEELVASNEELQSTNEELHSVNEELYTVNAEYQKKIAELTEMTDDMDNLLRSTDIGTIFLDRELCIRKFTPQIARAFDLLPQDVGRRIDSFSHSVVDANLHDDVASVLKSGTAIEKEVRDRHGSHLFLRILPYRSHSKVDGVVLALIDISLLKRTETRLQQMSAIVESSNDAIIGMDLTGRITTWNQGAQRLYGYSADEVVGKYVSILRPQSDSSREIIDWPPEVLERMRSGQTTDFRVERVRQRKDGTLIDVLMSFSPIRDDHGNLIGISKIARDVTEQKRSIQALAQRARISAMRAEIGSALTRDDGLQRVLQVCTQSLVDHMGVSFARIWTLNREQNMLELCASAGLYTHLDGPHGRIRLGELKIGRIAETRVPLLTNDVQHDPHISDPQWARREGMVGFAGYPLVVSDSVVGVLAVFSRTKLAESALDDLRSICFEVAQCIERKRAEEARKRAEEEAREGVRRRDLFLAMLSHELRTPLAAIVNAARLLESSDCDAETLTTANGAIARQSRHMARLLDDLLDVSRITRNKIEIRRQVLDLRQTTRDAMEAIQPLLNGKKLQFHTELPRQPLCVDGDPARLQQIQVNLLNNAIKYTPAGGKIWISLRQEDGYAVLSVRDTGVGIPQDMLDRIFEIFVQLEHDPGSSNGGMGVGLTLVRALVDLHGGKITVHSDGPGKGSEFTLRLPAVDAARLPAKPAVTTEKLSGLRVLLVEDNGDLRYMTERILKTTGCEVHTAADGHGGIEAFRRIRPNVALIDIGLPDLDGCEVARRIRAGDGGKDAKLIAVTGYGQEEDRQNALRAGFDAHVVKPVAIKELTSLLRSFHTSDTKK